MYMTNKSNHIYIYIYIFNVCPLGLAASRAPVPSDGASSFKNMRFSRHTGLKSAQKHKKHQCFGSKPLWPRKRPKRQKHVKTRVFPLRRLS